MERKFQFLFAFAMCAAQAFASVYYVAVDGKDSNIGSKEKPFASLNKANAVVHAGDTVWIRGGVYDLNDTVYVKRYQMTAGIHLNTSGESDDKRIYYFAYPGERPIFDGANLPIGIACKHKGTIDSVMTTSPIVVEAKYLHLKGFEIRNTPMKCNSNSGIFLYASKHIILEEIESHHNAGPGFFINDGVSNGGGHLILNCDAHNNYDPTGWQGDGENADGFGVHYQEPGDGDTTRFIGCRSWWNSDDGFDFINQEFPVVLEDCYAMGNGYTNFGLHNPPKGNGYGIKMGESTKGGGHHLIKYCVAWKNKASGFYANYTGAGSTWLNNTSYMNEDRSFNMASRPFIDGTPTAEVAPLTGDNAHVLKNNIAFPNKNSQIGSCWYKSETVNEYVPCTAGENNTWNLNLDLTEDDFMSLDDPSMTVTGKDLSKIPGILGPRNPDGSVPNVDFLKLKEGSLAIDKGEDVGLPFAGKAPDLGAYEFGLPSSSSVASESSNSSDEQSSSASVSSSETTGIAQYYGLQISDVANAESSAKVFDMQGRFLGVLQAEETRGGNLADVLRAKFHVPGVYLVRWGRNHQIIAPSAP